MRRTQRRVQHLGMFSTSPPLLIPPAVQRQSSTNPCCTPQLIDRNNTRRGIGASCAETLHV